MSAGSEQEFQYWSLTGLFKKSRFKNKTKTLKGWLHALAGSDILCAKFAFSLPVVKGKVDCHLLDIGSN